MATSQLYLMVVGNEPIKRIEAVFVSTKSSLDIAQIFIVFMSGLLVEVSVFLTRSPIFPPPMPPCGKFVIRLNLIFLGCYSLRKSDFLCLGKKRSKLCQKDLR